MVAGELVVHAGRGLAELDGLEAVVPLGQLLLDDVGLDRDAQVVGLAGHVRGRFVVDPVLGEGRVAQVAPQHRGHAQLVRVVKGDRDLLELPVGLLRAPVDGRAHRDRAHVPCLLDRAEQDLVVLGRIGQELVVVQLADERDPVRVAARHRSEDSERGGDGVAAALDRQFDDLLTVEIHRVGGERRAGGVLDALVDRQDRKIAGPGQPSVAEQRLEAPEHPGGSVAVLPDSVDEVWAGQVQLRFGHGLGLELQQACRVGAEYVFELGGRSPGNSSHQSLLHI